MAEDAAVTRPYASTVVLDNVYAPGVTVVVAKSKAIVPFVVMGEPLTVILPPALLKPTDVTVPVLEV